jgi:hypothetical protein
MVVLAWLELVGGGFGAVALLMAAYRGWIGLAGVVTGLLLLPLVLLLLARLVWGLVAGGAGAVGHVVLAAGNLPPAPSFSREEALVLQGRIEDARAGYEARLADDPGSIPVRLALAALHRDHRRDDAAAERVLLEVRALDRAGRAERTVSNALIDLYERTGRRGRLMAEYARFAARNPGTPEGQAAQRRLRELKQG